MNVDLHPPEELIADDEHIHVLPLFGREHYPFSSCWCRPEPDDLDPRVIVHRVEH